MKKLLASLLLAGSVFQANAVSIQEFASLLQAEPSETRCTMLLERIDELLAQAPNTVERVMGEAVAGNLFELNLLELKERVQVKLAEVRSLADQDRQEFAQLLAQRRTQIQDEPVAPTVQPATAVVELTEVQKAEQTLKLAQDEIAKAQIYLKSLETQYQAFLNENDGLLSQEQTKIKTDLSALIKKAKSTVTLAIQKRNQAEKTLRIAKKASKSQKTWGQTFAKGAKVAAVTATVVGLAKRYIFSPSK
ncbi:hypothetical protein A3F66_04535 [candidate division TM6 bacterium RIFCSPHIGHO2_12_FULL_32_22]|nr:MAG: hypothetical protein A3F66_04535 [candidate division TM6 bacterium RIFCSPHIGHO2_12_FULL_32_22]